MINSNKLMKKIFLFILNLLFILINILSAYCHLVYILKNNTNSVFAALNIELVLSAIGLIPIYLILALIFYFLKNYLCIDKLNRRLPTLAVLIYTSTIVIDSLVVEFIRNTKVIPFNMGISSPTNTYIMINFVFSIILIILAILCTIKSLLKD